VSAEEWPECAECGDPIDYCPGHAKHSHGWRWDLSVTWCEECGTCSDFCSQINPF